MITADAARQTMTAHHRSLLSRIEYAIDLDSRRGDTYVEVFLTAIDTPAHEREAVDSLRARGFTVRPSRWFHRLFNIGSVRVRWYP